MWVRRQDQERLLDTIEAQDQEIASLKVKLFEVERNPKQWTDADLSLSLIENIARVHNLNFVGSPDDSFFLLQRTDDHKTPGDGVVW